MRHRPVIFLGEINIVGQQRLQCEQLLAQCDDATGQSTIELAERQCMRSRAAGIDQVTDRLGLEQVQLAVQYRATRELTRFGQTGPGMNHGCQHGCWYHEPTMRADLEQVLAGERVRGSIKCCDHVVDDAAILATHGTVRCTPNGHGNRIKKPLGQQPHIRPTQTHERQCATPHRRCDSRNCPAVADRGRVQALCPHSRTIRRALDSSRTSVSPGAMTCTFSRLA